MPFKLYTLPGFVSPAPTEHYRLRLAEDEETVRKAQRLRFEVFNLEMREGLAASEESGLDRDEFDPVCDHLVVETVDTGTVIGTYRLQTGANARKNHGYYSEREFDFTPFEGCRDEVLELGRACVAREHRSLSVLSLLFRGIAQYARLNQSLYMLGCSSVNSRNPAEGAALYRSLPGKCHAPEHLRTKPLPALSCDPGEGRTKPPRIPRLMQTYLLLGAKVCGPPALDLEFGTIDFLTLMDVREIPARYRH